MATLHVFNPEHDIALASNLSNFTAPHAGRQLRKELGFLPAVWAGSGDYVLVDDIEAAQTALARMIHKGFEGFVDKRALRKLDIDKVEPWGWDLALRAQLLRYGVTAVPSEAEIQTIRELSHRKHAAGLLKTLQTERTTGCAVEANSLEEVKAILCDWQHIVVKAPWSSSGRGIRFIDDDIDDYRERWIKNTIERQGSVIVELYNNKVKDFGMEFESDGKGHVSYLGLSLFQTQNGAYTGNILASEADKQEMISRYISIDLLNKTQEKICDCLGRLYEHKYKGPLGVDMMVVATTDGNGFLLNPCVEINLRRTMGHVALALTRQGSYIKAPSADLLHSFCPSLADDGAVRRIQASRDRW